MSSFTVLPVTLTRFTAAASGAGVRLAWATASEIDNDYFAVERSADGRAFAAIGRVAGHGSTAQQQAYTYLDERPAAGRLLYYRLRQVDTNGAADYSPVRTVAPAPGPAGLALRPNPTAATATLDLTVLAASDDYLLTLRDLRGRLVREQRVAGGQRPTLTLADQPAGVYLVTLVGPGQASTQRLVKE